MPLIFIILGKILMIAVAMAAVLVVGSALLAAASRVAAPRRLDGTERVPAAVARAPLPGR